MNETQDAHSVAEMGRLTVAVSMTTWTFLVVIAWGLIGYEIHRARKRCLTDLENGAPALVGTVDGDVPLENVLQGTRYSEMPTPAKSSFGSWSETQPRDSQGSGEGPPIRDFFHKITKVFKG
ncbi:hypothetical protein O1611_g1728 [Lasiodiplodia mahajangana]|uniref:Uncharacterized protein n=1 Tax=Lasiodiplodia mahajangana TaxID=1108764 RepID=A0ACC2JWN9_9PEZI|nr:hypothetical protein O1611_g1728 [Lasiodiplodia mahajangana]